jgi:hypothetical protein
MFDKCSGGLRSKPQKIRMMASKLKKTHLELGDVVPAGQSQTREPRNLWLEWETRGSIVIEKVDIAIIYKNVNNQPTIK